MDEASTQNFTSVCRLCLCEDDSFISVFDENYRCLPERIAECVNVQVHESDKMTTMICRGCLMWVEEWYEFKKSCEDSQLKLKTWVNNNEKTDFVDITIKEEPDSSIDDPMQILETSMCIKSEPIDSVYLPESEDDELELSRLSPTSNLSVSAVEQMDSLLIPALECPASVHGINAPFYSKNNYLNGVHKNSEFPPKKSNVRISDLGTDCRVCSKSFSNVHNRFRHERTVHSLEREVSVTHFMTSTERSEESITDNSETSSNLTLEQFAASLQLVQRNSAKPLSEKQFVEFNKKMNNMMLSSTCECCNLMYTTTDALLEHLSKEMNVEPFTCFLCCITFPNEAQYVDHAQQNFCEQRANLIEQKDCQFKVYQHYECSECHLFYVHEIYLTKHLLNNHMPDVYPANCTHCSNSFDNETDYKQHLQGSCFYRIYCSICKLTFSALNEFQKHSKVHDDDIPVGAPRISNKFETETIPAVPEVESPANSPPGRKPNDLILMTRTTRCQLCGKQYSNFHNLLRHIKNNHKNKLISCMFCDKKFLLKEDFRKHINKEHKSLVKANKNADAYTCEMCDAQCTSLDDWCDHQHTHAIDNSFSCGECDQSFDTEEELEQHKSTHSNLKLKLYRCSDSNSYKTINDFSLQSYNLNLVCDICNKYFKTEEDLEIHKALHVDMSSEDAENSEAKENDMLRKFNCPFCKKSYSCYSSMWKHKKKHHGKNPRQFLRMVSTKHFGKKRICPICYKVVPNPKALWYHKKKFHGFKSKNKVVQEANNIATVTYKEEIEENEENFVMMNRNTCDICHKKFTTLKGLSIHARQHAQRIKTEDIKKYKCTLCPKECPNTEILDNHMKCHSEKPMFVCPVCEKHFINNAGLASHVRIHSNKSTPAPVVKVENDEFKCSVCSVTLSSRSALSNHVKVHLRDSSSSHVCSICQRKFSGLLTLMNHMKYVHGEESPELNHSVKREPDAPNTSERYGCNICNRSFLREGLLKNHLKAHEMNNSNNRLSNKKYKCNQCSKTLPSSLALARHIKEHDFIKLSCNECNKKFHSAGALSSHKGWHLRANNSLSNSNICTACDMSFDSKTDFINHIQSHKQKLHCQYCGRNFYNPTALKKHITLIHGNESVKLKKKFVHHNDFKPMRADRTYKCTECNAIFANAKKLRLHVSMHSVNV